jgi:hypothetical protein
MKTNFKCLIASLILNTIFSMELKKLGASPDINILIVITGIPLYFLMLHKFITTMNK